MNIEQLLSETLNYLEERTDWDEPLYEVQVADRYYTLKQSGDVSKGTVKVNLKRSDGRLIPLSSQDPESLFNHLSYQAEKDADPQQAAVIRNRRTALQKVVNKYYLTKNVLRCGSLITPKEEEYVFVLKNKDGSRNKLVNNGPFRSNKPVFVVLRVDRSSDRARISVLIGKQTDESGQNWVFSKAPV
ncbi:hypothetical protein [Aeromonas rivipollensis]|uniref:hypothetical protein n=1 Tax=Aeromonas rivipollensis TaxID=948519 RepID=UPI003D2618D1